MRAPAPSFGDVAGGAAASSATADDEKVAAPGPVQDAAAAENVADAAVAEPAPDAGAVQGSADDVDDSTDDVDDSADDVDTVIADDSSSADGPAAPGTRTATWASRDSPATALLWVDPAPIAAAAESTRTEEDEDAEASDILADAPRGGPRAGWLVPTGALVALVVAYTAATLLWPLHELPASVQGAEITVDAADPAALTWPSEGSAAISVAGVGVAASASDDVPIASITKVVSVMLVLEELPLAVGEHGPEYAFTRSDSRAYWTYLRDNQSALDVPVGGVLTEYQMLQGILLGSANNYIDRLADEIWGSDSAFADAAQAWLSARGLDEITIVTPSGRNEENTATPEALTRLAEIAMANPVFAEIVGTASVDLPGAGTVDNSNGLLGEPGIVGVKTGTLGGSYNLLSAKDVTLGDTTVRLYAAMLGQDDDDTRLEASRVLFTEVEAALQAQGPAVAAGTVVGSVSTPWGADADIVTDADAQVVLWNSATATADVSFDLGEATAEGAEVGSLTVAGPLETASVPVSLAEELAGPSPWWRLTHPLELFGIVD